MATALQSIRTYIDAQISAGRNSQSPYSAFTPGTSVVRNPNSLLAQLTGYEAVSVYRKSGVTTGVTDTPCTLITPSVAITSSIPTTSYTAGDVVSFLTAGGALVNATILRVVTVMMDGVYGFFLIQFSAPVAGIPPMPVLQNSTYNNYFLINGIATPCLTLLPAAPTISIFGIGCLDRITSAANGTTIFYRETDFGDTAQRGYEAYFVSDGVNPSDAVGSMLVYPINGSAVLLGPDSSNSGEASAVHFYASAIQAKIAASTGSGGCGLSETLSYADLSSFDQVGVSPPTSITVRIGSGSSADYFSVQDAAKDVNLAGQGGAGYSVYNSGLDFQRNLNHAYLSPIEMIIALQAGSWSFGSFITIDGMVWSRLTVTSDAGCGPNGTTTNASAAIITTTNSTPINTSIAGDGSCPTFRFTNLQFGNATANGGANIVADDNTALQTVSVKNCLFLRNVNGLGTLCGVSGKGNVTIGITNCIALVPATQTGNVTCFQLSSTTGGIGNITNANFHFNSGVANNTQRACRLSIAAATTVNLNAQDNVLCGPTTAAVGFSIANSGTLNLGASARNITSDTSANSVGVGTTGILASTEWINPASNLVMLATATGYKVSNASPAVNIDMVGVLRPQSGFTTSGAMQSLFPVGFGSLSQWRGKLGSGVFNRFRWRG